MSNNHKWDLDYIKQNLGIDVKATSKEEAHRILREREINTTSWVLSALAEEYGEDWAAEYRTSINNIICTHGFIGECPYCKHGTD